MKLWHTNEVAYIYGNLIHAKVDIRRISSMTAQQ